MTKGELIAALQASPAPNDAPIYAWDVRDGYRHEITSVDDGTPQNGVLDINCNEDMGDPDEHDE